MTKRCALLLFPFFILHPSSFILAQSISGVINTYAHVIAIDTCLNAATVASTNGFAVGDSVLIIQMKGATIDTSNTASYGTILSMNGAGQFEIAAILSLPDLTTIRFANKLLNIYDTKDGAVQLVRIPQFKDVTVADTLRPKPWDPNTGTGGVLALEASGTLTLKAQVDASYCGFWGGFVSGSGASVGGGDSVMDYAFDGWWGPHMMDGGYKGEGIARWPLPFDGMDAGRGAPASGGGGGNSHNAGGGGGANGGVGGRGGDQTNAPGFGRFANGGEPGSAPWSASWIGSEPRIFMGGGGGGGHQNDHQGTIGGYGGGIVILRASKIVTATSDFDTIQAIGGSPGEVYNGGNPNALLETVDTARSDGAGGGGAGGTILMYADSNFSGNFLMRVRGGDGGSVDAQNGPYGFGPGGGGGGGVYYKGSGLGGGSAFWGDNIGGKAGRVTNCSDPAINYSSYGAADGVPAINRFLSIPESESLYVYPAAVNHSLTICAGDSASISASGADSYLWSPSSGLSNGSSATPNASPDSTTLYTVQMMKGNCAFTDTVHVEVLANPDATIAGDTVTCDSNVVTYSAPRTAGVTYQWTVDGGTPSFGTGTTINVRWSTAGTGLLALKASNGMCSASSTRQIKVAAPIAPVINATQLVLANVGDTSMLSLADSYVSYLWSTGETTSTITVDSAGIYSVTVIDANGCTGTASVEIDYPSAVPSVELALGNISAYPGDHVILPVNIITSQNLGLARATNFTYTIHFDQSLLEPLDPATTSTFRNGQRYVTKRGTISNQLSTNSLDQIEFLAALGDATETTISFDTVIWTSGKPIATTLDTGHFSLLGICPAGGNRLFYASGNIAINEIHPNPVTGIAVADYSLLEPGTTTLVVLDMLGRTVLMIESGDAKAGEYHAAFDASMLPNGLYNLVLRTPSQVFTKRLEVYR